jgi:hypothetical protein
MEGTAMEKLLDLRELVGSVTHPIPAGRGVAAL